MSKIISNPNILTEGTGRTLEEASNDGHSLVDQMEALQSATSVFNGTQVPGTPNEPADTAGHTATNKWNQARKRILTADYSEWGNPGRRCNTMVTVNGVATRYCGNWFIETVEHVVGKTYVTNSTFTKTAAKKGKVPAAAKNTGEGKPQPSTQVRIVAESGDVKIDPGTLYDRPFYNGERTPGMPPKPAVVVPKKIK